MQLVSISAKTSKNCVSSFKVLVFESVLFNQRKIVTIFYSVTKHSDCQIAVVIDKRHFLPFLPFAKVTENAFGNMLEIL